MSLRGLAPIAAGDAASRPRSATALPGQPVDDFRALLGESLGNAGGIKFSAHAMKRLESRGIGIGPGELAAIGQAVEKAAGKGSRESLVLGQDYAMLINVPSRTVITAFDTEQLKENVITNIDSAVFIPAR